jgi:hypothetical protein
MQDHRVVGRPVEAGEEQGAATGINAGHQGALVAGELLGHVR